MAEIPLANVGRLTNPADLQLSGEGYDNIALCSIPCYQFREPCCQCDEYC
jgi:hypothetical protein